MAIHFRSQTLALPEANGIEGGNVMPFGRYFGFMLGAESAIGAVRIDAGDSIVVGPGMIVPIRPFEGTPEVRCLVRAPVGDVRAPVHVIGLTECYELALAAPRRAPLDQLIVVPLEAATLTYAYFPFGRRHALITALSDTTGATLSLTGHQAGDETDHTIALATEVPFTDGVATAAHLGGTDHEEPFAWIGVGIEQPSAGICEIRFAAFGEPGG